MDIAIEGNETAMSWTMLIDTDGGRRFVAWLQGSMERVYGEAQWDARRLAQAGVTGSLILVGGN